MGERLKASTEQILLSVAQMVRDEGGRQDGEDGREYRVLRNVGLVYPLFGYDSLDFLKARSVTSHVPPAGITVEQIGENQEHGSVTRLTAFGHYYGDNTFSVIDFRSVDGRILSLSRESQYLGRAKGSRWYLPLDISDLIKSRTIKDGLTREMRFALDDPEKARLVEYSFYPHTERESFEAIFREGSANIIFYWDIKERKWIYLAHSSRPIGTPSNNPDIYESARRDSVVAIEPFGNYIVPQVVEVSQLAKNMIFPLCVPSARRQGKFEFPNSFSYVLEFIGITHEGGWNYYKRQTPNPSRG